MTPPINSSIIDTKKKHLTKNISLRNGPGKHFPWKEEKKYLSFGAPFEWF
jgi:hypothetical protein